MFGQRLRQLRQEEELTLRELSENLDISFSTLGHYERGEREPDFNNLEKIADYFHVRIDYLLGRSEIKTFHEYVFDTDIFHFKERLNEIDRDRQTIMVDILDSLYLWVMKNSDNKEILKLISTLNRSLWHFDIYSRRTNNISDQLYGLSEITNKINNILFALCIIRITGQAPDNFENICQLPQLPLLISSK